jgi:hypothetical protein
MFWVNKIDLYAKRPADKNAVMSLSVDSQKRTARRLS